MAKKRLFVVLLLAGSIILAACGQSAPSATPTATIAPTEPIPAPTQTAVLVVPECTPAPCGEEGPALIDPQTIDGQIVTVTGIEYIEGQGPKSTLVLSNGQTVAMAENIRLSIPVALEVYGLTTWADAGYFSYDWTGGTYEPWTGSFTGTLIVYSASDPGWEYLEEGDCLLTVLANGSAPARNDAAVEAAWVEFTTHLRQDLPEYLRSWWFDSYGPLDMVRTMCYHEYASSFQPDLPEEVQPLCQRNNAWYDIGYEYGGWVESDYAIFYLLPPQVESAGELTCDSLSSSGFQMVALQPEPEDESFIWLMRMVYVDVDGSVRSTSVPGDAYIVALDNLTSENVDSIPWDELTFYQIGHSPLDCYTNN